MDKEKFLSLLPLALELYSEFDAERSKKVEQEEQNAHALFYEMAEAIEAELVKEKGLPVISVFLKDNKTFSGKFAAIDEKHKILTLRSQMMYGDEEDEQKGYKAKSNISIDCFDLMAYSVSQVDTEKEVFLRFNQPTVAPGVAPIVR